MARPPKELVDAICESLRDRPEEWRFDEWSARHVSGRITVVGWCDGETVEIEVPNGKFGGLLILLCLFVPWRHRIVSAALKAREWHLRRAPKPGVETAIAALRGVA